MPSVAAALPLENRREVGARINFAGNEGAPKISLTPRDDLIRKTDFASREDAMKQIHDPNREQGLIDSMRTMSRVVNPVEHPTLPAVPAAGVVLQTATNSGGMNL